MLICCISLADGEYIYIYQSISRKRGSFSISLRVTLATGSQSPMAISLAKRKSITNSQFFQPMGNLSLFVHKSSSTGTKDVCCNLIIVSPSPHCSKNKGVALVQSDIECIFPVHRNEKKKIHEITAVSAPTNRKIHSIELLTRASS